MIVVDASVAVKWYLSEINSRDAVALLTMDEKLVGPSLIRYEVASALVRSHRRGDIDNTQLHSLCSRWLSTLERNVLRLIYQPEDLLRATKLASEIGHPLADCLYLALAERLAAPLVTADAVFFEKVGGSFSFVNLLSASPRRLQETSTL
jgi:predicted nucleic acid-binding protein